MNRALALILILLVNVPLVLVEGAHAHEPTPTASTSIPVRNHSPSVFSSSDPLSIFLYVRNNFDFEPYYGYMKGVNGTLNAAGGNDFDQAAVLVHLLRSQAHVQARYVEGTITLNMSAVENWLGVETRNATVAILAQSGVFYQFQADGNVRLGHVWVEAYLNGGWVQMDPSFKQYVYHKSALVTPSLAAPPLQYGTQTGPYSVSSIDVGQLMKQVEYYQTKVSQAVQDLGGTYPCPFRTIAPVQEYMPPLSAQVAVVYDEIPAFKEYYVEATIPSFDPSANDFTFASNVSARFPTTALSNSRITLYFIPVDEATLKYVQGFPNLLEDTNLDVSRVKMYPVLRFNSTYKVVGTPMPLGYIFGLNVRITMNGASLPSWSSYFSPVVGTWNSIVILTGDNHIPDMILADRIRQLNETAHSVGKQVVDLDDIIGATLDIHGRLYLDSLDSIAQLMQSNFDVTASHLFLGVMTGYQYTWASGRHIQYSGPFIDAEINAWSSAVSVRDDHLSEMMYHLAFGSITSILEGKIIQLLYGNAPVSTGTLLEAANEQGIPIFIIDKNNWQVVRPQLALPQTTMAEIDQAVKQTGSSWAKYGVLVVPQRPVTTTALTLTLSDSQTPHGQVRTYRGIGLLYLNSQTLDTGWRLNKITSTGSAPSNSNWGGDSGTVKTEPEVEEDPIWALEHTLWKSAAEDLVYKTLENHPGLGVPGEFPGVSFSSGVGGVLTAAEIGSEAMGLGWQSAGGPEFLQAFEKDWGEVQAPTVKAMTNEQLATFYPQWMVQLGIAPQHPKSIPNPAVALASGHKPSDIAAPDYPLFLRIVLNVVLVSQYTMDRFMNTAAPTVSIRSSTSPAFSISLVDRDGRRAGFDPLTGRTYSEINYLFEYGATMSSQRLGLWDVAPGNYTITIANYENQDRQKVLLTDLFAGTTASRQSMNVQMQAGTILTVPLRVSYDYSNGAVEANLGASTSAAFISFDKTSTKTISGKLQGAKLDGLGEETIRLFSQPTLNFSDWKDIGNIRTSTDGHFSLDYVAAPPGESAIMAVYKDLRAFTSISVPFSMTLNLQDRLGQPIARGSVAATANGKTVNLNTQNGLVTFDAYAGYNVIEVTPLIKIAVYAPVPCSTITVQLDIQETKSTTSLMMSSSSTITGTTGTTNSTLLAALMVIAVAFAVAAIALKKRRKQRQ